MSKVVTIAHVAPGLEQQWLQHLRDFDLAHPDCHFEVAVDANDMTLAKAIEMVKVTPRLDVHKLIEFDYVEALEDALQSIVQWSETYPTSVFPEPDLKKARALLEAGGITLDSVSAYAMRHVVVGVGKIARDALKKKE
jgi:hypothetical protein